MNDEEHFLSIWVGQRPAGHKRTIRSGEWKLESSQHQSSEGVVDLMIKYLRNDLSTLRKIEWEQSSSKISLDVILFF